LPAGTKTVSLDSGYDASYLGEVVEWNERGKRTGRRFLCPENPRGGPHCPTSNSDHTVRQRRSRILKAERQKFLKRPYARRLYSRRKKTVEPFNQWFKSLFELDLKVWHRGLENNRTQILASMFTYQLLVRFNHRAGRLNGRVRWIIDAL
jgi:hypothetical protein